MNQDNRVLGRKGARDLNPAESEMVRGGLTFHTLTLCTAPFSGYFDGDPGECA
jgi:hypothetical protein